MIACAIQNDHTVYAAMAAIVVMFVLGVLIGRQS